MQFDVVLMDPSWEYTNKKTGGSHQSGAAQKYPTIPLHVMKGMPIRDILAKNCVGAMWCTTPMGKDPYELLEAYGFRYKTELYWHKVGRKGTGYWLRGEVEKLLIGIRGNVKAWRHNLANWVDHPSSDLKTRFGDRIDELRVQGLDAISDDLQLLFDLALGVTGIEATPTQPHSRKPPAVRDLLTALTPGARRAELYATERAEGWESFGLEIDPLHNFLVPGFWDTVRALPEPEPEALHA